MLNACFSYTRATHKQQVQRFALLRRMLRCGDCGIMIQPAWTNNHGRQYRYYTCSKRIKAGYGKCKLPTLRAGEIALGAGSDE